MGKLRSPVLGFNHNVKHLGIVFHVQTEDSGVDNPHIITHLFHGGVILATRKLDYDPESDADIIKTLMQSQHKAILKHLKHGEYNQKIQQYFPDKAEVPAGTPPETQASVPQTVLPGKAPALPEALAAQAEAINGVGTQADPTFAFLRDEEAATASDEEPLNQWEVREPAKSDLPAQVAGNAWESPGSYTEPARGTPPPVSREPKGKRRKKLPATERGVVVAKPSVIVNAPSKIIGGALEGANSTTAREQDTPESIFGQDVGGEKSLDEVILAYLDEDK